MYAHIQPSEACRENDAVSRLRENVRERLEKSLFPCNIIDCTEHIFANIDEEDIADASIVLSHVPGVQVVSPSLATVPDADKIKDIIDDVAHGEPVVIDAVGLSSELEAELLAFSKEEGQDVSITRCGEHVYVSGTSVEGIGGVPIDPTRCAVVVMTDRASTVAAYRTMLQGYKIYPVYTGRQAEQLDEDMALLRQFDPDVKLTVMKGEDDAVAAESVCDLVGAETVVIGETADDEPTALDVRQETVRPNSEDTGEDVLTVYRSIVPPEF